MAETYDSCFGWLGAIVGGSVGSLFTPCAEPIPSNWKLIAEALMSAKNPKYRMLHLSRMSDIDTMPKERVTPRLALRRDIRFYQR